MPINIELLDQTMAHIEAHPREWHQRHWRCGTGMCFAGHAATLAGGQWVTGPDDFMSEYLAGDSVGDVEWAPVRAARLLGLDEDQSDYLFAGSNTIEDLRRIVAELKAEAATQAAEAETADAR